MALSQSSPVAAILVHEFADLPLLPLLADKRHPAIGRETVRQETDTPAEERPERPVDLRGGHGIDNVQDDIDRDEDSDVDIEPSDFADATACLGVPICLIVGYRR